MSVPDMIADLLSRFVTATDMARRAVRAGDDEAFCTALVRLVDARARTIEFATTRCADDATPRRADPTSCERGRARPDLKPLPVRPADSEP